MIMEKKKRQVNQVAETGHTVAANIKRLRGTMQYKQLAERLAELGRPIAELGLRKIESGERKVDVDDLMAFAIVFGVSPLTILLPDDGSSWMTTRITGYPHEIGDNVAWLWARGDEPLELPEVGKTVENHRTCLDFIGDARPESIDKRGIGAEWDAFATDDKDHTRSDDGVKLWAAQRMGIKPAPDER